MWLSKMSEICLNGAEITAENIFDIAYKEETKIKIDNSSKEKVNAAQKLILNAQNGQIPVYGLTRDVGQFKNESLQTKLNYDMEVLAVHSTTMGKRVIKNVFEFIFFNFTSDLNLGQFSIASSWNIVISEV